MERTGITSHRGNTRELVIKEFQARYGQSARLFRAPGRVNLIGEHTDYNDGFVMPAALGFSTWVGIAKRNDRTLRVHSSCFDETVQLSLDRLAGPPTHHWSDYIRGVTAVLELSGYRLPGASLLI